MAVEALALSQFVAAGLMLLLAAWLLGLSFENRVNRGFALFLSLRAAVILTNQLNQLADAPATAAYWERLSQYFLLAVPVALAYFLVAYTLPRGTRRARIATWSVIGAGAALELLYLLDHCLVTCRPDGGPRALGPLSLLTFGLPLADAAAAWVLARDARGMAEGPRRAGVILVGLGFVLNAIVDGSLVAALTLDVGLARAASAFLPSPWVAGVFLVRFLALGVALAALWQLRALVPARRRRHVDTLALVAIASGGFVGWNPALLPGVELLPLFTLGLWRLLLPVLATYALVRHRLFDLDVRVKWTLSKSPVAFAAIIAFLVASEMAQSYIDERYGWISGGVATGLILFFLAPLERAGHRLAQAVLPDARPLRDLDRAQRLDLYRSQADLAWADGVLDRSERALLDALRERLGLTHEEAAGLERQAMGAGAP